MMKYIVDACKHELADDEDELITTKMSMHYSKYMILLQYAIYIYILLSIIVLFLKIDLLVSISIPISINISIIIA